MKLLQDLRFLLASIPLRQARSGWALAMLLLVSTAAAQVDNVLIYGTVKDLTSSKKLDNVTVTVFKNGAKLIDVPTNASGKYELNLDYGSDYKIVVSKGGYVGKNIKIDTRKIPEEERQGGHGMNIDFSMLFDLPGIDYSILNEPFGMASYAAGTFTWDIEYTNRMRDAQARLMKEYEELRKREGDAEAQFAKLMQTGTTAMGSSDFKKAVDSFTGALALKANDAIATAKLSDARMRMEGQDAEKRTAEKYAALIKEADGLFSKKDYAGAKTKYSAAIDVKDQEVYPKQKVKEIEAILIDLEKKAEEERKAKELQEKYQAAITAADAALKAESWDQATAKYTEALELKPSEKYPKDQLALVATKKAEAAKKAEEERKAKELEEKYKAAIAAADGAFKSSTWETATAKYTEASELKPQEKYPKDQLAAIILRKAEAAKKAEEERLAKEVQERYQAAITAADAAFRNTTYDEAEAKYNEAIGIKKEEKYPKDQLAAIAKKREELAKKAEDERKAKELDDRYKAAIAAADAAFGKEEWEAATVKYNEAIGLKAQEKYPKDQLAAIAARKAAAEKKAEEERKLRELEERYNAMITAGDAAFTKADHTAARAKYVEASALKPAERYPKDRIAEVDALLAEAARKAEADRKAAELEARYAELIKSADKAYDGKKLSEALNDYKDALKLKPAERHPQDRIAAIEQQLDSAAKSKAEEERLLREKQERDRRYTELITSADKAFSAKTYEKARVDYTAASEVKPDEKHPKDRLAEISRLLADASSKAEQDRLAAERDAAEKARKAEQDRLAAESAAAEKARLEEEERRKRMATAEIDAEYNQFVAAGDIAFTGEQFDKAREKYTAALGVKPGEKYPKDRLAAIDAAIAARDSKRSEADRLAAEKRRLDEERRAREAQEAEAARLAAGSERERAEAERLRKEQEAADARRSAADRERLEREGAKALEERYRSTILRADEALAARKYVEARGIYAEASDIKPAETYPLAKIDQIDKLLAEQERLAREAELAAQRSQQTRTQERSQSSNIGSGQEDEAVRFMREAREREEAEKYDRIKKFRSELEQEEDANSAEAAVRRAAPLELKERVMEDGAQLYMGNDERRMQRAEELLAYQEALARAEAERRERAAQTRSQSYQENLAVVADTDRRDRTWSERHTDRAREAEQTKEEIQQLRDDRYRAGLAQNANAREEVLATADRMSELERRGESAVEAQRRGVEDEKRAQQARETSYAVNSANSRLAAKEKLDDSGAGKPRAFADYNRSKLAQEYPQGVTEESYTEGNKVIIRRVVVDGNKADEFSKVIAKWGTFYFKNGQSITEAIWTNGTEG